MEPATRELFKENAPKGGAAKDTSALHGSGGPDQPSAGIGGATIAGTPISGVCSNMPTRPISPSTSGIEDLAASPVRSDGGHVSTKNKTAIKKFSAKSRNSSGSKHSVAGLCRRLDADLGTASGSPSRPVAPSPLARSPAVRTPASTARKGRRVQGSGESVAVRAERRAAAKDLPPSVEILD